MTENAQGPVAVITGGGTGIGAATARRFAEDGARVAVIGRRREPLERVATDTGGMAVVADAADAGQAADAVARVVERFGRIDVLIANAGGHGLSTVGETSDDEWASSLRANVTTAFAMARAALPQLIDAGGAVVIVSSLAGLFAGPGVAGYTVGKHALIGLTRSLARDYGKFGVRVNAVCPGWVRTPMADAEMDDFVAASSLPDREAAYATVTANVPLGRAAEPAEIASIIRFLASSDASYVTGSVLVADGGAHIVDLPTIAFGEV
jgi:meso-butanediol dehydrogenase/(S,S)-butanediol dehydrogenase/diacetyl reductase